MILTFAASSKLTFHAEFRPELAERMLSSCVWQGRNLQSKVAP